MISILIDYKLEHLQKEIKYAFGHIFQSLGYSYNFITGTDTLRPNDILIIYAFSEPSVSDLQALARQFITIYIPVEAELYDHKAYTPEKLRRNLKEVKLLSPTPVISSRQFSYPAANYTDAQINAGKLHFDLIGNVFFHLSSMEEKIDLQRGENGFYPETASAFFKYREYPYVDNLLWLINSLITEHSKSAKKYTVQKLNWPKGQDCAVVLTHSVDDLQKWDIGTLVLSIADDIMMAASFSFRQLWHHIVGKIRYLFTNFEQNWNFDEFRQMEREAGVKSSFFIAAHNCDEIDYSLDDPDLQEEIHDILREGNEIGLLITDDKRNRDEQLTRKHILQHQTKQEQIGCRQLNYLVDSQILESQQAISPAYTMNSAFLANPGFRNGIGLPWYRWLCSAKALQLEIPVIYRDQFLKLHKYKLMTLDDAKHSIKRFLQTAVRAHGVFGMDFRIASYTDIHYCPKLYPFVMALIKSGRNWICTANELASWWEKRSRVLIDESEYEFSVYFQDSIDSFTLQYTGEAALVELSGATGVIDGNLIRFNAIEANTIAIVRLKHTR